jgi:TP901-1 family phage major tail protein
MAKYCGKDLLLQMGNGASPEVFTTIGAMKSNSLTINNEKVDVTTKDDMAWQALLACGVRSMAVTASGPISSDVVQKALELAANTSPIKNFKIVTGRLDVYQGSFLIGSFARSGEHNGAEQWTLSLDSAGAIAYTPPT